MSTDIIISICHQARHYGRMVYVELRLLSEVALPNPQELIKKLANDCQRIGYHGAMLVDEQVDSLR